MVYNLFNHFRCRTIRPGWDSWIRHCDHHYPCSHKPPPHLQQQSPALIYCLQPAHYNVYVAAPAIFYLKTTQPYFLVLCPDPFSELEFLRCPFCPPERSLSDGLKRGDVTYRSHRAHNDDSQNHSRRTAGVSRKHRVNIALT
jgi:hypothetical protein